MSRIKFRDFPKICRLCLTRAKTLTSIYLNEHGTSFENMILEVSTVYVEEFDELPSQICKKCGTFLAAATAFRKKTCESDKLLRDILDKYRASCASENEHTELPSYKCSKGESKGSNSSTDLDEADPSELDDPLIVDMKFEASRDTEALRANTEYLVETEQPDPLSDTEFNNAGTFCIIGPESSESILPQRQEETRKTTRRVGEFFRNVLQTLKGTAAAVEQVDVVECSDGDVDMTGPAPVDPLTTGDGPGEPEELSVHCGVCGERFATRTELRDHRRFIGHRRFGCADCARRFERKQSLAQHIAREHPVAADRGTETQWETPVPAGHALEERPLAATQIVREILEPEEHVVKERSVLEEQLESEVQSVLADHVPKERLPPQKELCQPQREQPASDKLAETAQSPANPNAVEEIPARRQCNLCGRQACRTADCTIQVEVCLPCIRESQPDAVADASEAGAVDHMCNMCGRTQAGTKPCTLLVQACRRCIRNARSSSPKGEGQVAGEKEEAAKENGPATKATIPPKVTGSVSEQKASSDSEVLSSEDEGPASECPESSSQSSWSEEGFVKPIPPSQTWPLLDASDTSVIRLRSGSVVAARLPPPPKEATCSACAQVFPSRADLKEHELATMHNRVMCRDCDPERSLPKASLKQHRETEHSASPCSVCAVEFPGRRQLWAHQRETMHGLFACELCDDRVDHGSRRGLQTHVRWTHRPPKAKGWALLCPHCGTTKTSRKFMELHILMHSHFTVRGREFTCNVCQTMMSKNMVRHLAAVHELFVDPSMPTGLCSQCGVRVLLSELPKHTELHRHFSGTGDMSVCNICNEGVRRVAMAMHLKNHKVFLASSDLVYCADCGEGCVSKETLIVHLDSHVLGLRHCDECNVTFPNGNAFHTHRRAKHHRQQGLYEKPHACPVCKKRFRKEDYVIRHLRSHTGEKPFVCPTCSRGFSLRPNLIAHMRQHTDETPYKCPVCGKGFKHNVSRKNHMKYHEDSSLRRSPPSPLILANQNVASHSGSGDDTDS